MGAQLKQSEKNLSKSDKELGRLNDELKLDLARAALDVAGIADPTPISDGLSGLISLGRGDFVGAGLSLISMVPYAGDALGKSAKGARLSAKIAKLEQKIASRIMKIQNAAREQAAKAVRQARANKAKARIAAKKKKCPTCKVSTNPYGTRLPADGSWSGTKGNSSWTPDPTSDRAKAINKVTGGKPVQYKDGYPDFSSYAKHRVEINMKGNTGSDFTDANKAAGLSNTPKGYTWHHHQDGKTMELVPTALHKNAPHTGGSSVVRDKGY